ncbi:MAG: ABC transporter substrate-binding protein [Lachnospiraceae bacterium]
MKKLLATLCIISLSTTILNGCSTSPNISSSETSTEAIEVPESEEITTSEEITLVNIATLSGPTCMGLVSFMDEVDNDLVEQLDYDFSILTAADEISTGMVKGTYDFATVPANLASVLFNNTNGQVQVLGINTLGVLYIVETGTEINSISDLEGKTIYASGKGTTPEFALNYILSENELVIGEDVFIEWKSEQAECLAAIAADDEAIAMLPQPFATSAQIQNESIRIALDLTAEWDNVQASEETPSMLVTGVVIGRTEFIENNPEVVADFLDRYDTSVSFVNQNNDEAAALVGYYGIVTEAIAQSALPACNIVFIQGEEMKTALTGYLGVLFDADATSIGSALPTDDFYYISE